MTPAEAKFLLDPYLDWTKRESIPVHEGVAVDLLTADTGPWPRLGDGGRGAFVHLVGRGDWMTVFLLDLPGGGASAPQRHLFDEVFFVLAGSGRMVVETPDGGEHTIDFGPRSLFAPPLNARHRIVNGSAHESVRLACANDLRILMNLFHDEAFFFDNPFGFPERAAGQGAIDASAMEATICDVPAGASGGVQRSGAGFHILCIEGSGHTLIRHADGADLQRVDWRPGLCFALPETTFHEHVNTGARAAQHLAMGFGTARHPIVSARWPVAERNGGARGIGRAPEMPHGLPEHSRLA